MFFPISDSPNPKGIPWATLGVPGRVVPVQKTARGPA